MSGKSTEEYASYTKYLCNSDSTVTKVGTAESISDGNKIDELAQQILNQQISLFTTFPNLSLISSTIEDTIIVLDDDEKETKESKDRRKKVLDKLNAALDSDIKLLDKIRKIYPDFCMNMKEVLGDKYHSIYAKAVTMLRDLCVVVAATPVFENGAFDFDDLTNEDIAEVVYIDLPDGVLDSREDIDTEEPPHSKDEMLIMISEKLDTDDFQRACIIAKTYLKDQLDRYSKTVTSEKVDEDVKTFTKSNNSSLEIINKYTAYLNMPKTFNKPEDKEFKPKEDEDLTY